MSTIDMSFNKDAKDIATTILTQLGGGSFIAMTGAKNLSYSKDSLQFSLPNNLAKKGINRIAIHLMPDDTYTIKFFKLKKDLRLAEIACFIGLYVHMLKSIFTRETGLYLNLF